MSSFLRKIKLSLLVLTGAVLPYTMSYAVTDLANGWGPTPIELARLPMYCQKFFTAGKDLPKVMNTIAPGCDGVHHLCAGLVLENRLSNFSIPKDERRRIWESATREVNYMAGRPNSMCLSTRMQEMRATQQRLRGLGIILR